MENPGYSYYLSEFKILLNTVKEREDWDEATKGRFLHEIIRLAERDWESRALPMNEGMKYTD